METVTCPQCNGEGQTDAVYLGIGWTLDDGKFRNQCSLCGGNGKSAKLMTELGLPVFLPLAASVD